MRLTRAAIEAARNNRRRIEVELPEGTALLRELSGTERDKMEAAVHFVNGTNGERHLDPMDLRARLVALCLIDDSGERLYADDEVRQLNDAFSSSSLAKLWEAAQTLNAAQPNALEAAEKNSEATASADSVSA